MKRRCIWFQYKPNKEAVLAVVDAEQIDIAAENTPYQTVISGEVGTIQKAIKQLAETGYKD